MFACPAPGVLGVTVRDEVPAPLVLASQIPWKQEDGCKIDEPCTESTGCPQRLGPESDTQRSSAVCGFVWVLRCSGAVVHTAAFQPFAALFLNYAVGK